MALDPVWYVLIVPVGIIILCLIMRLLVVLVSPRPKDLGVKDGKLAPCKASPNGVSTQMEDEYHKIDPIPFKETLQETHDKIIEAIKAYPRTKIIKDNLDEKYLYVNFMSKSWGFVDDVEFYFDEENNVVQFRSQSRIGYGDMGENRKRLEWIRAFYEGKPTKKVL
jgi:uncharacterized protein (DUF1499 family)